ncbi:MAG: exosortase C-terminal domain/associated protein EpsI [Chlamydiota bacterium]
MISANARFAIVVALLAGAALFLHTRTRQDLLPPGPSLSSLPRQFNGWSAADLPFAPQTLAALGPGEFLQREYRPPLGGEPYVDVYLAHRPNQQALARHLPTECLLGAGWSLDNSGAAAFSVPGEASFSANRFLVTRGSERQLVLFWFWAHGRGLASQNWADFYLTLDSLRLNRKDNLLVRINTPLRPGESAASAQQRLLSFAAQLNPQLDRLTP